MSSILFDEYKWSQPSECLAGGLALGAEHQWMLVLCPA